MVLFMCLLTELSNKVHRPWSSQVLGNWHTSGTYSESPDTNKVPNGVGRATRRKAYCVSPLGLIWAWVRPLNLSLLGKALDKQLSTSRILNYLIFPLKSSLAESVPSSA